MPLQSKDDQLEKSTFVYEVKQNDFTEYFRNDDLTLTDLMKEYANSDKPFVDLQMLGEKITEAGFAELEQNGNCTAVTVDIDKNDLKVAHYDKDYENGEHTFRHSSLSAAVSDIMNDTQEVGHIVSDTEVDNVAHIIVAIQEQLSDNSKLLNPSLDTSEYKLREFCEAFNSSVFESKSPERYEWNNDLSDVDNIRNSILTGKSSFISSWAAELRMEEVFFPEKADELRRIAPNIKKAMENIIENYVSNEAVLENEIATETDIEADLNLAEETLAFSVVSIDGEDNIVVGGYVDEEDIIAMEEYESFAASNENGEYKADVNFYVIGNGNTGLVNATEEQTEYISNNLDAVLRTAELMEANTYPLHINAKRENDREYTQVNDYLDMVLEAAQEQHSTAPTVPDDYISDSLLLPDDFSELFSSVKEIKCDSFEWLPPEQAVECMNAEHNISPARLEQLNVTCISADGRLSQKDISPEAFYVLHNRTELNREQLKAAVDKRMSRKAEIVSNAEQKIDSFKAMSDKEPEKLLPFLNTCCNRHVNKLENLNEKNVSRVQKIHRHENKIVKYQNKAERLENTNKMLTSLFGGSKLLSATLNAIVARNQNSVEKLRNEKIPNRENKIAKQLGKIDRTNLKIDIRQCKVDKLQNVSKAISSFSIISNPERRQQFAQAMDGLHDAQRRSAVLGASKIQAKIDTLNESYESASMVDKIGISVKIKDLLDKKQKLSVVAKKYEKVEKLFTAQPDEIIDKVQNAAEAQCVADKANTAEMRIESLADKVYTAVMSKLEQEVPQQAVSMEEALVGELDKSSEILSELKGSLEANEASVAPSENNTLGNRPNIIGNEKYENIKDKFFVKMSAEKAEEISAVLKQNDVKFSGRIYENKEATITLNKADLSKYRTLTADRKQSREQTSLSDIRAIDKKTKEAAQQSRTSLEKSKDNQAL